MTTIDIPVIKTDALHSEATYVAPAVNVRLVGSAESEALGPLGDLLGRLHGEAVRLAVREVTVDVRELEFMNSFVLQDVRLVARRAARPRSRAALPHPVPVR